MKVLKVFICVLITILCIFTLSIGTMSLIAKKNLDSKQIKKIIDDNGIDFILESLDKDDKALLDSTKKFLVEVGIPKEAIDDVLNSKGTKNFISTYISNCVSYLLNENEEIPLTKKDLKELISSNIDVIETSMNKQEKEFIDIGKKAIYDYIDKKGDKIIAFFPTPKDLLGEIDQSQITVYNNLSLKDITEKISFFISNKFLLTTICISIAAIVVLILTNLKRRVWAKYLIAIGFTYSAIMLIIKLIIDVAIKLVLSDYNKKTLDVIKYIANNCSNYLWISIISSLIISIILCIIYGLRKKELTILTSS